MNELQKPDFSQMNAGQILGLIVSGYMIIKPIFNFLVLGGSIAPLLFGLAAAVLLYLGIQRSNLVIAALLMLVACTNLINNLRQIGFNQYLIYTIEGVIDMGCAVLLAFHPAVREHCKCTIK